MPSTPPPPPPPLIIRTAPLIPKPAVPATGPPGAFLVELLVFNGSPFADHWAYWVRSHASPDIGVQIHADGDVRTGFRFEIKRSRDLRDDLPTTTIPLQWADGRYFDEEAMLNYGEAMVDNVPVSGFEASVHKVKAPEKTLNAIDESVSPERIGKRVTQRNCQTWIVEAADQLVEDGIFTQEVAVYLHAIKQ